MSPVSLTGHVGQEATEEGTRVALCPLFPHTRFHWGPPPAWLGCWEVVRDPSGGTPPSLSKDSPS
jgi:hypothetical protein